MVLNDITLFCCSLLSGRALRYFAVVSIIVFAE